jgi:hypothetical protein
LRRLKGDLYLGYRAVVAHPLRLLFHPDDRTGKEQFLANYGPEGLVPLTEPERAILRGASRCIHCGLCDAVQLPDASRLSQLPRWIQDGPSLLPLQYSRATPDLPHARRALETFTDAQLARGEAVCPTRVPLRALVVQLRVKLAEVDALMAAAPAEAE